MSTDKPVSSADITFAGPTSSLTRNTRAKVELLSKSETAISANNSHVHVKAATWDSLDRWIEHLSTVRELLSLAHLIVSSLKTLSKPPNHRDAAACQ